MTKTLNKTLAAARSGKSKYLSAALTVMDGKPVGNWGETRQARRQLAELLPAHWERNWTVDDWIDATCTVKSGIYRAIY